MPQGESIILAVIGGVFLLLGILSILWGRLEEKRIFEALAAQRDLREFSMKHVDSPQPGALKTGGWIAIALGVIFLIVALVIWLVS